MKTPVCDFVKEYANSKKLRLHMPGHKGYDLLGVEHLDITEIEGADVLYQGNGIIKESEDNAAFLFDTAKTVYSTEGSSLAIRAMVYLAVLQAKQEGKKPLIAAGRNAHKTFITATAIMDVDVEWIHPDVRGSLISCEITPANVEEVLKIKSPTAVYVTSPDYLGNTLDIEGIAKVCHRYGVLLLVDNAHGAYLRFLPTPQHPISLGADMCCDSAHKTLPVLTGGAYLHISKNAPASLCETAETAMSLFASTSPSYLILQSLDMANKYICNDYKDELAEFVQKADKLNDELIAMGYDLVGDEPLKITIYTKPYGYEGYEISDILLRKGIVCEFADPDYVVMMVTPKIAGNALEKIKTALAEIDKKPPLGKCSLKLPCPKNAMTPKEALFMPGEEVSVEKCEGRILATPSVSCPPAIPIAVCGEVIDHDVIEMFKYYGIDKCRVVK